MCFKKTREEDKMDFFKYICEEYFTGSNSRNELAYEEIISEIAQKFLPDMDEFLDKEKDFTIEETCELCRDMAVKTLLLFALQDDKDNVHMKYIQENYPAELESLLENNELMFVTEDKIVYPK